MTFDGLNGSRGPRVGRPVHGAEWERDRLHTVVRFSRSRARDLCLDDGGPRCHRSGGPTPQRATILSMTW